MDSKNNFSAQHSNDKVSEISFLPESELLPELEKPLLLIKKSQRKLELFDGDRLIKTYKIALGFAPVGDKEIEGDGKTPEGDFYIFTKNDKSKFYLSLGVSYPNIEDAERGVKLNIISKAKRDEIVQAIANKKIRRKIQNFGGEIYLHGGGILKDWTQGCIALKTKK